MGSAAQTLGKYGEMSSREGGKMLSKVLRLTLFLAVKLPLLLLAFVLGNLVKRVAPGFLFQRLRKMNGGMLTDSALQLNSIEDMQFLGSAAMLRNMVNGSIRNILKGAKVGDPAVDGPVFDLTKQVRTTLLAAAKPGRPLVLNFGSCT